MVIHAFLVSLLIIANVSVAQAGEKKQHLVDASPPPPVFMSLDRYRVKNGVSSKTPRFFSLTPRLQNKEKPHFLKPMEKDTWPYTHESYKSGGQKLLLDPDRAQEIISIYGK